MKIIPSFILLIFLLSFSFCSNAQVFLQLEKIGSLKLEKYAPGQTLTYAIKGYSGWQTSVIKGFIVEQNIVLFENGAIVKLADIEGLKEFKGQRRIRTIAFSLYSFGLSWGVWSLLGTFAGSPLTWLAAIVPAVSFVTGFLLQKIFRGKRFMMGKKWRLRIVDVSVFSVPDGVQIP